jgi:hypothetical protein
MLLLLLPVMYSYSQTLTLREAVDTGMANYGLVKAKEKIRPGFRRNGKAGKTRLFAKP